MRPVIFVAAILLLTSCGTAARTVPTIESLPTASSTVTASIPSVSASPTPAPPTATDVAPVATSAPPTATTVPGTPAVTAAAGLGPRTKTTGCLVRGSLPDPTCSPGAIFTDATTAQICVPGYASRVRDVPQSEKDQVYAAYGIRSHAAGQYEVDHLVSLELGGSNDNANLWPEAAEPRPGFHEKDKVENWLHDQVCSGKMPLHQAQEQIATNWLVIYQQMNWGSSATVPTAARAAVPSAATATSSPAPPTATPIRLTATPVPAASSLGHTYYLSSYRTAHEYYCDDDPAWHRLSTKYLVHLPSEAAVHQQYPTYTLHRSC